jgi:predicted transposase YbfD/YdcC
MEANSNVLVYWYTCTGSAHALADALGRHLPIQNFTAIGAHGVR